MSLLILKKSFKILNKVKKVHACTLHKMIIMYLYSSKALIRLV